MDDTQHKIIKLLIEVGLAAEVAEELAENIEAVYKEAQRQKMSIIGKKGGKRGKGVPRTAKRKRRPNGTLA